MAMKRCRIGEYAKQMGVSIDCIEDYESKGVIRAVRVLRNHCYDCSQSRLIHLIQHHRSFGFTAQEAVALPRYVDDREVICQFDEKEQVHRRRVLDSTHITTPGVISGYRTYRFL